MSDETTLPNAASSGSEPDWFLQWVVHVINEVHKDENAKWEFGITLQVGGLLVSGVLVSGAAYFDAIAALVTSGFTEPEAAEQIKTYFAELGSGYREPTNEGAPMPSFVHLKNARFFSPAGNPIPSNSGVWWRGRISEVGGFTFGLLGPPKEDD